MTISSVGFSGRVPRLCAQKKNANLPYPVKKVCSFFYKCPLEHCTVFSNYLLDCERTGNMGTSFFTPLWQIECTSLVIATLKENNNFLYPQKKVMSLLRCAGPAKKKRKTATSPRGAKKFWNDILAHTFIHPLRQSNTSHSSVWVKRSPHYRGFCHSAKKGNASQMQMTLEWISELVCSALTCMLEVTKFWYIPLD